MIVPDFFMARSGDYILRFGSNIVRVMCNLVWMTHATREQLDTRKEYGEYHIPREPHCTHRARLLMKDAKKYPYWRTSLPPEILGFDGAVVTVFSFAVSYIEKILPERTSRLATLNRLYRIVHDP